MKFASREFSIEYPRASDAAADELPTLRVAFLSLAGVAGTLPFALSERMLCDYSEGSKALHAFLDLLNRRFWELLFFAQGVNGNPQYALLDRRHARVLADISFAVTGLRDPVRPGEPGGGAPLLHRIQRNCFAAGNGVGDLVELGQLLSAMLGADIRLQQHLPFLLKVATSSRAMLSTGSAGARLARNAVAGLGAWVACAWVATVTASHPAQLKSFLPGNTAFQRLLEVLGIFWGHARPPLTLRLQSPTAASFSELGCPDLVLGWGARIASRCPASQIIDISSSRTISTSGRGTST